MSLHRPTSRRKFLQVMALLLAAGELALARESRAEGKYRVAPWTGDDFTIGHRMRNGETPPFPLASERSVDFVIVGGGMSGLSTAYYLRDQDFLLLEQYEELGGQSRGRSYRGIDYSLGAAYMSDIDGIYGELLADLGIKPAAIPPTKNCWYWHKEWFPGVEGKDQAAIYRQFERLISECKPVWKLMPEGDPRLPLAEGDLRKLDSATFASYLQSYDPQFVSLMDKFCQSSFCESIDNLSALAGFWLAQDLVNPDYVFEGGNPALARALASKVQSAGSARCLTGAFVWSVTAKDGGVEVVYGSGDGSMHRVRAKRAIVTAPPLVAARIVPDLADLPKARLLSFKFGAYLVANFCMPKKVFDHSYDNWCGSPFTFADITVAESPYQALGHYKPEMGSVLTVYQPYTPNSSGRAILFAGDREELSAKMVDELSRVVEQFQQNLEEVVLTRWGHAMVTARPGFFGQIAELQSMDTGPFILAHNSIAGPPCAESAIKAARRAADLATESKRKAL